LDKAVEYVSHLERDEYSPAPGSSAAIGGGNENSGVKAYAPG